MSVFTTVSPETLSDWLRHYSIGTLVDLQGIAAGIENTNYFVTTTHGRYVLTLFEKLTPEELPYYLNLMDHLAKHGIAVAAPVANHHNELLGTLEGKPACLVQCLPGKSVEQPTPEQCAQVGDMLADMHLAGQSYTGRMDNPRGPLWWSRTAPELFEFMSKEDIQLLKEEIAFQAAHRFDHLPRGVIHADLFRDNVLLEPHHIGGFIDFYFACHDILLYDLAITLNDWCVTASGDIDPVRAKAMLSAYHSVRFLSAEEKEAWPVMLRAAGLRFWVSRLYDKFRPRAGELTFAKDPDHFKRVILHHRARPMDDNWL